MNLEKWNISAFLVVYKYFWGVLIEKESQVTSHVIFYKSNIVLDTIVDVEVIVNILSLELPLVTPVIATQALY